MTDLSSWTSPDIVLRVGWALVHSLWQGAGLAALAALALSWTRKASIRYVIALGTLAAMVVLPVATVTVGGVTSITALSFQIPGVPGTTGLPDATPAPGAPDTASGGAGVSFRALLFASVLSPPYELFVGLVFVWSLGVISFSLRAAGSFWTLGRLRRRASEPVGSPLLEACRDLQSYFGLTRHIRFRWCSWLATPAVVGWFRPIVFLPVAAVTGLSEQQLRLVIAHELAHIRRWDALFNLLQVASEALLFYHPAAWWLNRRIREEREHCCDDAALALCQAPLEYARALTLLAHQHRAAPALAMAANRGPLATRISRILCVESPRPGGRSSGFAAGALCLAASLLAGHALALSSGTPGPAPSQAQEVDGSIWGPWTPNQRIALEVHEIREDYFRGLQAAGLSPDFGLLMALHLEGVTPEQVQALLEEDLQITAGQMVSLAVQGVTLEWVRGLKAYGLEFDASQLIALKIHDVTPGFVRDLRATGLRPTTSQTIALKVHEVHPEYIEGLFEEGLRPTVDQILALHIHRITPEDVRTLRAKGVEPTLDRVIASKKQGELLSPTLAKEDPKDLRQGGASR